MRSAVISRILEGEPFDTNSTVLVLTRHDSFAQAAVRQLAGQDCTVRAGDPLAWPLVQAAMDPPAVALVDLDACTADGRPLWAAVESAYRCPVVLIATLDQASQAASTAQEHGLCDYLLTTAVGDPARLAFLIHRSRCVAQHSGKPRPECGGPILVVEDDETSGELAKGILEQSGYEVILTRTFSDAKAAFVRHRPALVLVDIHLGSDNGIDLVRAIRTRSTWPHTPIIMVSSDQHRRTVIDAGQANVQGYLLKPYDPAALIARVQSALANGNAPGLGAVHGSRGS